MKSAALIGLAVYFLLLMLAVLREKKSRNQLDYFFAGRELPFWALSLTFVASWWGAGSALSTADLAYEDGLGAFIYYGAPVLIATAVIYGLAPVIRRLDFLTQGALITARYCPAAGRALSVLIFLFMTLNASTQMVGLGMFFGTYLGMGYEEAVFFGTAIVILYSMFGGFRAVVLTDIIQFVFLTSSAFLVFWVAMDAAGGWAGIAAKALLDNRPGYTGMTEGLSKYLIYVITFGCSWAIQANIWQRVSAARNVTDAKRMAGLAFVTYVPLYLMVVLTGMAGFVIFPTLPEGGVVTTVVTELMHPALGALVFVGIAAAIMSTMDSLLNTAAMTLTMDLGFGTKSEKPILYSRLATLIVSAIALVVALSIRSILDIAWLAADVITTGVFIPLTAALFSGLRRWRSARGALFSMAGGLLFSLYNLGLYFKLPLPAFWTHGGAGQIITGLTLSLALFLLGRAMTPENQD